MKIKNWTDNVRFILGVGAMNISEHLAVEVMGWRTELSKLTNKPCRTKIYITDETDPYDGWVEAATWNPPENIEQAFMCLDKFNDVNICKWKDTWFVQLSTAKTSDKSLANAISLACAEATGWKE